MHSSATLATLLTAAVCTAVLASAPAQSATPTAPPTGAAEPRIRLTGELLSTSMERHATRRWHAVRVGDQLLPVRGDRLGDLAPGSRVTLDLDVPSPVVDAAQAGRTLRVPAVDGQPTTHDLDPADVDAASDATPATPTSALGRATVETALAPGSPELAVAEVVASAAPAGATYAPATRRITYVSVTPRGLTRESVSSTTVAGQVGSTDAYWRDNSRSTLKLGAPTIRAQYTSAHSCANAGPFDFWAEAIDRLGWTWEDNSSLVLKYPRTASAAGCGYGYGTLGSSPNDGGVLSVSDTAWPVLAHEIGHNMSLGHANWLTCPGQADVALVDDWWPSTCTEWEYEDGFDVMGYSGPETASMLASPQAVRTGMLEPAATRTVGAGTATVTLSPLAGLTGVRAALVTNAVTGVRYHVEYRTASGRDAWNSTSQVPGVRVLRLSPSGGSVLLDPTPGSSPDGNAAVAPGRTLSSHDGRITVTTVSTTPSEAVVRIANNATLTPFVTRTRPTATGTRGVGKRLTATKGTWSPSPTGYGYRWKRNGANISGAWKQTYTPTTADAGRYLTVTVTARRTGYTSKAATSGRVGIPIHSTTRPYLRGTAKPGRTLTVMVGAWTPKPSSYAYQWYRNGSKITGATKKTYTVRSGDRGRKIQAKVTARRSGYSTGTRLTYSTIPR